MATVSLPDNPSLDHLRGQARALQRAVLRGDPEALARIARHGAENPQTRYPLSAAQLVLAREYGFASWPRLRHYLATLDRYNWDHGHPADPRAESDVDRFTRLACLTYSDDEPERWAQARELLAAQPALTATNIWAAAAAADIEAVRGHLARQPALARRRGGPCQWQPLFYLVYSRLDPAVPRATVLELATLLLDAGADPHEGYLWRRLPSPFTLLTGAFGEGEQGPVHQPRHPHSLALARLLLSRGTDPNDDQTLYNRMFKPDNDHLEVLLPAGLGRGDGGVWRQRLGEALDPPVELLRKQLRWAVEHGFLARVQLLARYGVDIRQPYADGRTPVELARCSGAGQVAAYLLANGAAEPRLDPVDALVAAAMTADRAGVERILAGHPGVAAAARARRPGLMVWAAARGARAAIPLLAELGFDVNARGRGDTPVEHPHQTALHQAAASGDLDLARALLDLGADPDVPDAHFASTPLGWARHFDQAAMVELLAPLTAQPPTPQG